MKSENGKIYDENNYDDFHAYVTYPNITLRQYLTIKNHLNQSSPPKYNIVNYNCVNFVIEALEKAGIKHLFQKSFWNLGLFGNIIVAGSLGLYIFAINNINIGLTAISLHFAAFATAYGYYPAKFAYDINRGVK